jgi:hydrogenase-4 membrane subunit HyfE
MKRRELFTFVAGILGFIVDAIAFAAYLAQAMHLGATSNTISVPNIWGILVLIYGWFLVSWILTQRKLARTAARREILTIESPVRDVVGSSVTAIGLLLLPLAFMIAYGFLRGSQGAEKPGLEVWAFTLSGLLASMVVAGAIIFGAIYGLLDLTSDPVDF